MKHPFHMTHAPNKMEPLSAFTVTRHYPAGKEPKLTDKGYWSQVVGRGFRSKPDVEVRDFTHITKEAFRKQLDATWDDNPKFEPSDDYHAYWQSERSKRSKAAPNPSEARGNWRKQPFVTRHNDDEMPVPADRMVIVYFRGGTASRRQPAGEFYWGKGSGVSDIVGYHLA